MNWYLAKLVYQIVCGAGQHAAQFDEQLRLVAADDESEALEKAVQIGTAEEETFCNDRSELVQWIFINVSELHSLDTLSHGAELYSRITEVERAADYINHVHLKAALLKEQTAVCQFQLL